MPEAQPALTHERLQTPRAAALAEQVSAARAGGYRARAGRAADIEAFRELPRLVVLTAHDRQVLHQAVAGAVARAEILLTEPQTARLLLADLETDRSRQK
jgi:hypothetical protein